ncbi:MAG: hypothetical protein OEZ54_07785, partial [Gemmatimonadota bacterium]|nr:hypothetical protein [Gemmatimonadota bacterium]
MIGILGFGVMLLIAWLLSSDRSRVNWRLVSAGVGLQVLFGIVVLKTDLGRAFFSGTGKVVSGLIGFTEEGSRFIFGNLVANNVPVGSPVSVPGNMAPLDGATLWANTGAYFAFSVLPVIIFFSTLTAVLYYLGVLQAVVKG